jgi:hypothetical protein
MSAAEALGYFIAIVAPTMILVLAVVLSTRFGEALRALFGGGLLAIFLAAWFLALACLVARF